MNRHRIATAGVGLLAGMALLSAAATADDVPFPSDALPIGEILTIVENAGYSDVTKIERDDGLYEVKATDADGRRVELELDPRTGDVVKKEWDD